ncbi:hypothetical protein F443_10846 [Phytophthora nicotianae P1569]|uniref:Uncharacterized protein n=1 Tax=Phytophthora nicotianae P1569 TaxID=1317065 RepID=V9EYU9_PHYNI|nr:hypothetical protein F443_10846 [Phytophthora nicotianae P1569]
MARTMEVDKMSGGDKSSGQRQVKVSARTLTDQHVQVRPRTPPKLQQVQVDSYGHVYVFSLGVMLRSVVT